MAQSDWKFDFTGDPDAALEATQHIEGILGRELVSLQELIGVYSECRPEATKVNVVASELVGPTVVISQSATFDSAAAGGTFDFSASGVPAEVKDKVGLQTYIETNLRHSGRNACDQVNLTGAPSMTIRIKQVVQDGQTTAYVIYSFPYKLA